MRIVLIDNDFYISFDNDNIFVVSVVNEMFFNFKPVRPSSEKIQAVFVFTSGFLLCQTCSFHRQQTNNVKWVAMVAGAITFLWVKKKDVKICVVICLYTLNLLLKIFLFILSLIYTRIIVMCFDGICYLSCHYKKNHFLAVHYIRGRRVFLVVFKKFNNFLCCCLYSKFCPEQKYV